MGITYRHTLREIALGNNGYVTTTDAVGAGVPAGELPKLTARSGLEHISYGLYRFTDIPISDDSQFAEATLRAGRDSYLRGESVLALLGLASVNPTKITVGTLRRVRRKMPAIVEVAQTTAGDEITRYRGIRAQRVSAAILECRGRVPGMQLREATSKARAEGFITSGEWRYLRKELAD